jgi:hypothetical protein
MDDTDHALFPRFSAELVAIDEYRRDAVRKLEQMRAAHAEQDSIPTSIN